MPITITEEHVDENLFWSHYKDKMIFNIMECPFCKAEQVFKNRSVERCIDCTKPILDGYKLMYNIVYRVGFHLGYVDNNGLWTQDWTKLMTLREMNT